MIDDNSILCDSETKKHELVLGMKAISNYNDLKYRKIPAKRIRVLSNSGRNSDSGHSSSELGLSKGTAMISRNS